MSSKTDTAHNKYLLTVIFTSILVLSLGILTHDAHADILPGILAVNNTSVPTAGLVAEWRFENNASDTSGNGHNGATGGGTTYVSGKIGEALNFDGTGIDRIPYSSALDFPTSSFSTSLWIKTTSQNLGLIVDHRRNNDACYSGYSIEDAGSGKLVGRLRICAPATDTAANFDVLTNTVNDGSWHNIVFVVDRTNHVSKMYQDGVLVNSLDISALGNISQTSIGVDLGYTGNPNTPVDPFTGTLDQIRVYNRALTSNEVNSLYNEPSPPTTPPSPPAHLFTYSGNAQAGLSWSAPSNDGGAPITNYTIYRGSLPHTETLLKEIGNSLSYIDSTVTNGQTYYYYVTASNSAGQSSPSNEATVTPNAPDSTGGTVARTGLVAEWKFENNTFDSSGKQNNGATGTISYTYGGCCPRVRNVLTTGPGTYHPGEIGLALGFNGTVIDRVANSASLNFGNGSLSISGWIKTNQTSFLFVDHRRNNDGTYAGYSLEGTGGTILGRIRDSSGHDVYVQTGLVNDTKFHHIVFVVDRSTQTSRIYLDNKMLAMANISTVGNIDQNSIGVDLGYTMSPNTPNGPFVGTMDQVRIYNRTLTDNEIQSLYLEGPSSGQPTAPQNLVANPGNNQVALSWSTPSSSGNAPITNYNIYRGATSGGETFLAQTGNTLSYVDNTVSNGQRYFYEVIAVNADGESSASNEVTVVPVSVPSAPQIVITSVCNSEINLNWAAPNNGGAAITNYTIYRGASAGGETFLTEKGNSVGYTDTSVTDGQTYYYYVKAVNSVGQSVASNEVNGIPTSSNSCMPAAGLVGEWKFENNVLDTSGSGNNGVLSGGANYVSGKIGQALQFDGSTGAVLIPNSPSLNYGSTGSFSISTWIKSTQSGGGGAGFGLIIDHRRNNDGTYAGYSIEDSNGTIYGRIRDSSAHDVATTSTSNVNDGIFHNIVFVVDRATQTEKLYIDDNLQSSQSIASVGDIDTAFDLYMGGTASPNTPVDFFNGIIDQTRIYSKALSDSEIQTLFNEQVPVLTGVTINDIQSISGSASPSNQITLSNFNAGTGTNQLLVVGVHANNNNVASITFGGVSLTKAVSSFHNNYAGFWYLKNPTGTGDVVVTTGGATSVVVGAYSLSGVDQTSPIPTSTTNHNTVSNSPTISITTQYPNSMVLDLPSIYGGVTLGSPTCTQGWDVNVQNAITGASSSTVQAKAGSATCSWTASQSGDLWDDAAIEVKASSP